MRVVEAEGRRYALANVDGTFYAVDNNCPHNGGPLGKGRLEGCVLECPIHGWRWDLSTGRSVAPPSYTRVLSVPVRIEGDQVLLGVV